MKYLLIFSFILLIAGSLSANDNRLEWFDFQKGLEKARAENKNIIVHVYADWCKWCKVMEKETYGDSGVARLINDKFILIKFDGEATNTITYLGTTITQGELAQGFEINGFPTTLFLKPESEPITVVPGFQNSTTFINILEFISENHYQNMSFEEFIESKNKD